MIRCQNALGIANPEVINLSSFAASLFWLLLFVGGGLYLAYQRIDLRTATIATGIGLAAYTVLGDGAWWWLILLWAAFGLLVVGSWIVVRPRPLLRRASG